MLEAFGRFAPRDVFLSFFFFFSTANEISILLSGGGQRSEVVGSRPIFLGGSCQRKRSTVTRSKSTVVI